MRRGRTVSGILKGGSAQGLHRGAVVQPRPVHGQKGQCMCPGCPESAAVNLSPGRGRPEPCLPPTWSNTAGTDQRLVSNQHPQSCGQETHSIPPPRTCAGGPVPRAEDRVPAFQPQGPVCRGSFSPRALTDSHYGVAGTVPSPTGHIPSLTPALA